MKCFDEVLTPLDGDTLRKIVPDTDRDDEWPTRYGKGIVLYSILDVSENEIEENDYVSVAINDYDF